MIEARFIVTRITLVREFPWIGISKFDASSLKLLRPLKVWVTYVCPRHACSPTRIRHYHWTTAVLLRERLIGSDGICEPLAGSNLPSSCNWIKIGAQSGRARLATARQGPAAAAPRVGLKREGAESAEFNLAPSLQIQGPSNYSFQPPKKRPSFPNRAGLYNFPKTEQEIRTNSFLTLKINFCICELQCSFNWALLNANHCVFNTFELFKSQK